MLSLETTFFSVDHGHRGGSSVLTQLERRHICFRQNTSAHFFDSLRALPTSVLVQALDNENGKSVS